MEEKNTDDKITSSDIYAILLKKFSDCFHYVCAGEVGECTGGSTRRLDFVAVDCWASGGLKVHAFEIKVSKADLKRELMAPEKHNIFFDDIDTFSLVAPEKVVDVDLIPKQWGIYLVKDDGELVTKRKPCALHDERRTTMDRPFAVNLIRALQNQSAERHTLKKQLSEEYNNGYQHGRESIRYEFGRVEQFNRDCKWKERFCADLGLYTEESANRVLPIIKNVVESNYDTTSLVRSLKTTADYLERMSSTLRENIATFEKTIGSVNNGN